MTNKTLFDAVEVEAKAMGAALKRAEAFHEYTGNGIKEAGDALNQLGAFMRMVQKAVNQISEETGMELPLSLNAKGDLVIRKDVFGVSKDGRPALSERMSEELIGIVHQAVGSASGCWSNIDGARTFDAREAEDIAVELCYMIADEIEAERDAACGYIEITTNRECGSILRLSEVAVIDEMEGDIR